MKRTILAALMSLPLAGAAHAGFNLWLPVPEEQPATYSCDASAGGAVWYGSYSGVFLNEVTEQRRPYFAEGCFPSEATCRRWQSESMSYTNGRTVATSCRPGLG